MMRWILTCLCLITIALPMAAQVQVQEEVVAGLSQNRISINANFDGSEILIFGAVKRSTPPPIEAGPLQVIVTVAGPSEPVTVRRKEKRFGIWINTDSVEVDAAPSFYAVATTAPFAEVLSDVEDLRHQISVPRAIRSVGAEVTDSANFSDALIRIREGRDLYQMNESTVNLSQETLFNTSVTLPANLTEGDYTARILLTRGGQIVDQYRTVIYVQKVGLERWVYNLAHERPLIYGILSLIIAIVAGWAASAVFRYIRT